MKEKYEQLTLDMAISSENLVIQDNALIASSYDMTAMEQKLILILISTIKKDAIEIDPRLFRVVDIAEILGISPEPLYRDLPKVCKSLMSKVIEIKKPNGDWEMFNLIKYAKYKAKTGSLILDINEVATPYLVQLKDYFTVLKLDTPLQLDSKYAIRLYQLSKSSLYKKQMYFELPEFKKILKLDKKSYNIFNNITVKVLRPALLEINTKTDLNVEYELSTVGRKVMGIKFLIEQKTIKKYVIEKSNIKKGKQLAFTDYEQRTYDYNELERKLLGWDKAE